MYICETCNKCIAPHTKAHRVVVETRKRFYHEQARHDPANSNNKIIPVGWEIVKEILVCPDCINIAAPNRKEPNLVISSLPRNLSNVGIDSSKDSE